MSLDVEYAIRLAHRAKDFGLKWIEEALLPDDYWVISGCANRHQRPCW
jgi:L-rhamnonate dehydratase